MPLQPVTITRKFALFVCALLYALLLTGCGWRANGQVSREGPQIAAPGLSSISSITATANPAHEPTYAAYSRALFATAEAIAGALPTPSPLPNLNPDLAKDYQQDYLWSVARSTAVALFPPPVGYNPRSEITPYATPLGYPTDPPIPTVPYTATENGRIFSVSLRDNPVGKYLDCVDSWTGEISSRHVDAYAGTVKGNPNAGILIIGATEQGPVYPTVPEPEEASYSVSEYAPPSDSGALRIVAEASGRLSLQGADNLIYIFDINTRQWISTP